MSPATAEAISVEIEAAERAIERAMFRVYYEDLKAHVEKLNRELREVEKWNGV